jgi:uncharacterized protein
LATAAIALPPVQRPYFMAALVVAAGFFLHLLGRGGEIALLFVIGMALGVTLYHAAFGFTGAYRRAILGKDIAGITAQLIMLAAAMLLFAPILAQGTAFGHGVAGAVAPVSVSMVVGALIFGIGMQLAGGCGSGTLFTAGGGNLRMLLVLVFFCAGGLWATFDLHWWRELPGIGGVALGERLGWGPAIVLQLSALGLIYLGLRFLGGANKGPLWWAGDFTWQRLLRGPWPLLFGAGLLALLNWATLLVAGHPWSITWAFTLWGAKAALALGWDPASSVFWADGFPRAALARPVLEDVTSVMNVGIVCGALMAASLAGRVAPNARIPLPSLLAAVIGGLLLGYGARLAYGCNIGAFFSGVASTSLHGWAWIAAAIIGNVVGVRLQPLFGRHKTES